MSRRGCGESHWTLSSYFVNVSLWQQTQVKNSSLALWKNSSWCSIRLSGFVLQVMVSWKGKKWSVRSYSEKPPLKLIHFAFQFWMSKCITALQWNTLEYKFSHKYTSVIYRRTVTQSLQDTEAPNTTTFSYLPFLILSRLNKQRHTATSATKTQSCGASKTYKHHNHPCFPFCPKLDKQR